MKKRLLWVPACTLGLACAVGRAAFVNGVEQFEGTALDTNTWQSKPASFAGAVANGFLDLTGNYDLIAKPLLLAPGTTVSARVMLTAANSSGTAVTIGLTATPAAPESGQHVFAELLNTIQGESDFISFAGTNNSAGGKGGGTMSTRNVATWYLMTFSRPTSTTFTSSLYSDAGTLLYTHSFTYVGLPDTASLYIGNGPTARFDFVAIPEPTMAGVAAAGAGALLLRRRRRA